LALVKPIEEKEYINELQKVHITIWPFADVKLNGKLIAKHRKSFDIKLANGTYKLEFLHAYAATVEKILIVGKEPIDLAINLTKSKPAFLVISSSHEADVAIDGHYKGNSVRSVEQPIVVPLPDKTHAVTKEIIISKKGFLPIVIKTELIAGQIKRIEVNLIAQNN
jgi:hypothetical protein